MDKKELEQIKVQINEFRDLFKDNPVQEIKDGTWMTKILQIAFTENTEKLTAKYFKKKYVGLSNVQKAERLISTTSKYTAIVGGIAASAASAAELSTVVTGGWSLAAFGGTMIGEISYITYLQFKMVYEVSILLEAKIDRNDPEDILTIFWLALGLNVWEDVGNAALKLGPKGAEYLGQKALKAGISQAIEEIAVKIGGRKLAQKLSQKALLKLIVPGVNIPIAAWLNKKFTSKLGQAAVNKLKTRGATIFIIDELIKKERYYSILTIPLIYHVGIFGLDDKKGLSRVIEMQSNVARRLAITQQDEELIEKLITMSSDDFFKVLHDIQDPETAKLLVDLSIYTILISGKNDHTALQLVCKALNSNYSTLQLTEYKKRLGHLE
jgi:hypothetical protein